MSVTEEDQAQRSGEIKAWYDAYQYKCRALTGLLRNTLERTLREADVREPQIQGRTKKVDSLVAKSVKIENDAFKYENPRKEITDLIGLRVIVPLSTDQEPVLDALRSQFDVIEELVRGDESGIDVPGYRSIHLVIRVVENQGGPEYREYAGMVAEIQVRTILQHAWASLQHDLGYKADRAATPIIRRRLTALAGLIELADREFVDVRAAHLRPTSTRPIDSGVGDNDLNGPVTATSVRLVAERLIGEDSVGQEWFRQLSAVLSQLGIGTIGQLINELGPWADRAGDVHLSLQQDRPWINTAFTLDILLRIALTERYIAHRIDERVPGVDIEPDDAQTARSAVEEEVAMLSRGLDR